MAEYPVLPDPDPLDAAIKHAVAVLRAAQPHIALPPRRIELGLAADRLEQLMKEKSA